MGDHSHVLLLVFVAAFLIGSIPFGLLVARIFKVDIRAHGSGNIGATNVSRVVGFLPGGLLTFLLDGLKGALPVLLMSSPSFQSTLSESFGTTLEVSSAAIWATGFFAVLGHCFSPWVHFKGGKGVATAFGVAAVVSPVSALFGLIAFALTFWDTRIGSLSSLAGIVVASLAYLVAHPTGGHLWLGAAMVFLVLIRHESNLDALLENREKSFR